MVQTQKQGGDIVVFTAEARLDADAPPANELPEYVEKYQAGFKQKGQVGIVVEKLAPDVFSSCHITSSVLLCHRDTFIQIPWN